MSPAGVFGGKRVHAATRVVRDTRPEANLVRHTADARDALANSLGAGAFALNRKLAVAMGGKVLGAGQYGVAIRTKITARLLLLKDMLRGYHRVQTTVWPREGDVVVLKVQDARARGLFQSKAQYAKVLAEFVEESTHESVIHRFLSSADACRGLVVSRSRACPAVPRFYFAAFSTKSPRYVTVMGVAPGEPLDKYLSRHVMDAGLYARVEKAVASLWLAGVVHGDLHAYNVMYDRGTGVVTVIDFGWGILLRESLRRAVAEAVAAQLSRDTGTCLSEAWDSVGMSAYVDRVVASRRYPMYNSDARFLSHMYNGMSAGQRARVRAERRREWDLVDRPDDNKIAA